MKNHDEIWRAMEAVDAANRRVVPRWRDHLHQAFSGRVALPPAAKAELLGVPGRRSFLRVGGLAIAGAAVLVACGDDDTTASGDSTTSTGAGDGGSMDLVLANTAISLEALAILAYETAAGSGLVTTDAVGAAAAMFKTHHESHRDALIAVVEGAGATPFTDPNPAVKAAIVDPAVAAAATEADIVKLAFDLETAAAQTYVFAASALSTPELRSTIMTIGGVENRHAAVLAAVGGHDVFANGNAFVPATNPLPAEAVIGG